MCVETSIKKFQENRMIIEEVMAHTSGDVGVARGSRVRDGRGVY